MMVGKKYFIKNVKKIQKMFNMGIKFQLWLSYMILWLLMVIVDPKLCKI